MTSSNPPQATTVNVLAYNSSAVDPFTNTMVKSCTRENVTVKHDPIDFAGQVQKTTATLAGDKGTYDIIETYGFIIGPNAAEEKLQPLDDLFAKYSDKYKLDDIDESMREGMSYDGKLYGLPMQAQMFVMAYRKDVFDKNGLTAPKTFEEMKAAAKKIQDAGDMKYPIALPVAGDRRHLHPVPGRAQLPGHRLRRSGDQEAPVRHPGVEEGAGGDEVPAAVHGSAGHHLRPAQGAAADVQRHRRDGDHVLRPDERPDPGDQQQVLRQVRLRGAAGGARAAAALYSRLSIDGWSLPANTKLDPDLLFQMIAASVSEDASKASIPAALPGPQGAVDHQRQLAVRPGRRSTRSPRPTPR